MMTPGVIDLRPTLRCMPRTDFPSFNEPLAVEWRAIPFVTGSTPGSEVITLKRVGNPGSVVTLREV